MTVPVSEASRRLELVLPSGTLLRLPTPDTREQIAERKRRRQEKGIPFLNELKQWLDATREHSLVVEGLPPHRD